ncbi:MAG TPA: prepilin-type N-terminal cleavage/methylation domain-containing protein [Alphaproteobacteria bacterium]|nr:prepilin-type N-terminal cleavage/methylation domain-containing protein [Alphaproteobacteria bacterium]
MIEKFSAKDQGFTLIELLMATAISSIVIGAIFSFLIVQRKYFNLQEQVAEMTQNARAAMDIITSELTMAGYNPKGAVFVGLSYDTSQLRINADLNGDGDPDDSNEKIVYAYNAEKKQVTRTTGNGSPQPLIENVLAFNFEYLDANGNPTILTADIRQVRITLTVRTSKPDSQYGKNGGYRTYTLTSLVTPRNLAF